MQLLSSVNYDESERGIYYIAHALIKNNHESIIIASASKDDELIKRLVCDGNTYYQLSIPKKSWSSLRHVLKLKQIIDKQKPDIIHIHSRTPAWVLHWALKIARHQPKIISSIYGFYPINSYSQALFYSDLLICASKSIYRYIVDTTKDWEDEYKPFEVICVHRGVDVRLYPYRHKVSVHWLNHVFAEFPELEKKQWLLFATHIGEEQGQEWLIDIIGNLKEQFPKLHVVIMDDNSTDKAEDTHSVVYDDFYQRIQALGLSSHVSFVGKKPTDLKDWLSVAEMVLSLANRPESIGMTALQAIHLGTPVIGWDKGAFADILTNLYPNGLVKEETAAALCAVITEQLQSDVRPNLTHEYEIETMVEKILAAYQTLCQNES